MVHMAHHGLLTDRAHHRRLWLVLLVWLLVWLLILLLERLLVRLLLVAIAHHHGWLLELRLKHRNTATR